jgi:hypothetical protein
MLSKSQKANIRFAFLRLLNRDLICFENVRFLPTTTKVETLEIEIKEITLDLANLPSADEVVYDTHNKTTYCYWKSDSRLFKELIMFLHFNSH